MDFKNETGVIKSIAFPEKIWADKQFNLQYSWDTDGENYVYAPIYSHEIYITKNNTTFDRIVKARSQQITELEQSNVQDISKMSFDEYAEKTLNRGNYLALAYDKYRSVYYRFFWSGTKTKSTDDLQKLYEYPPNYGIMVLDKELNILGEIVLPKNIYLQHHFFIGKDGLYLAANHPLKLGLKEDELVFHRFIMN